MSTAMSRPRPVYGLSSLLAALVISLLASGAVAEAVRVEFYPLVGNKGTPIVAEYQGRRYHPPQPLSGAATQLSTPEERFMLQMMAVMRRGTLEQFIGLWEPSDREAVRRHYQTQKGLWKQLQRHHNQVPDQRLVNVMEYGNYSLVQILKLPPKLSAYVSTVVLKHGQEGLQLSNDLDGDAVHAYFATEFATRLVEEYLRQSSKS